MHLTQRSLAFVGIALLVAGCFAPLASLPIVGTLTYISGDGVFVLAGAGIAAAIVVLRRYFWLLPLATILLALVVYDGAKLYTGLAQVRSESQDNALTSALMQSAHMEWGWVLLIAGALCLGAAALRTDWEIPGIAEHV